MLFRSRYCLYLSGNAVVNAVAVICLMLGKGESIVYLCVGIDVEEEGINAVVGVQSRFDGVDAGTAYRAFGKSDIARTVGGVVFAFKAFGAGRFYVRIVDRDIGTQITGCGSTVYAVAVRIFDSVVKHGGAFGHFLYYINFALNNRCHDENVIKCQRGVVKAAGGCRGGDHFVGHLGIEIVEKTPYYRSGGVVEIKIVCVGIKISFKEINAVGKLGERGEKAVFARKIGGVHCGVEIGCAAYTVGFKQLAYLHHVIAFGKGDADGLDRLRLYAAGYGVSGIIVGVLCT